MDPSGLPSTRLWYADSAGPQPRHVAQFYKAHVGMTERSALARPVPPPWT